MVILHYPTNRKEIAQLYGITVDTLRRWLRTIGITHRSQLSFNEVEKIAATYGGFELRFPG